MNKVILTGRLTRDPEVRYTQGNEPMAIARYTLAVDRRGRKDGGEATADFIQCVAFRNNAEFAESKNKNSNQQEPPTGPAGGDGFMNIPEGADDQLPFN